MSYFHIGVIIATVAILNVSSQTVVVSPEYIITDVDTESVTFTCTVELDPVSATSGNWIAWDHRLPFRGSTTRINDNDKLFDQDKYSLYGMSSIGSSNITQSLTVHGIEDDEIGRYTCNLYIAGTLRSIQSCHLIIRNIITPLNCYDHEIEQQVLQLLCLSGPGDPPITLQWIDKNGNVLTESTQSMLRTHNYHSLAHRVPIESLYQSERFTCVATIPGSVTTQECICIGRNTIRFSFTYNQSTVGVPAPTENVPITSNSNDESGKSYLTSPSTPPVSYSQNITTETYEETKCENVHMLTDSETSHQNILSEEINLVTIIISVIGIVSIIMNVALLYITMRKNKQKCDKGMSMEPCGIRQQHGDSTGQHLGAPSQDNDGYMETLHNTPSHYEELGTSDAPSQDNDGYINYTPHYDQVGAPA